MIYEFKIDDIKENTPFWYVLKNIESNQKVLDVGCATGYLGTHLKNKLNAELVGIDNQNYHLEKAEELNVYSDLINLDLNTFQNELDKYSCYFDRIVICDVLEHLNDPVEVLKKLSKLLKNEGKFLIDLPNIAHSSIKYNLLTNNFNYTSMGLLDKTHIRFFTLNSIIAELSKNEFWIDKIEYIFSGPGQSEQYIDYAKYPPEIIDYIENDIESSIYQIFIVFKKSDLPLETVFNHNIIFKEFNHDLFTKKEIYTPQNNANPLKTLEEMIQEKNNYINSIEKNIVNLKKDVLEKNSAIINLEKEIQEKNRSIINLSNTIQVDTAKINKSNKVITDMKSSHSWRLTKPIRDFNSSLRKLKNKSLSTKKANHSPKVKKNNFNFGSTEDILKTIYLKNSNSYVKKSDRYFKRTEDDIKLIAFYLPQFHTIKENDNWWGKGFTEWTNVTRAIPQIEGHHQPQLPDELGYYDLSHTDIFYKQIELAKKYGIYGFCFHYYWFSGKKLLEKPVTNYLKDKNLDFPFMLCWANEPWTRAWDGSEREVLMPQPFEEEDYLNFIKDIMPFFKDDRYIKVNNCPVLIVYRPQYFSKNVMNDAIKIWRDYVKQNGFEDIYLINAESHNFDSVNKYENFDASVQFFSYKMSKNWRKDKKAVIINPEFQGHVYDYESFVKEKTYLQDFNYTLFRTVLPSWDNTARTMSKAIIFNNSSPELYKEWLKNVIDYTKKNYSKDNQFVFLHSWNEWAEGAHLEPDRKYGFAYLESTLDALESQKINK
jgi:ubiquinone/menaquinone biosynthesis C-methylase UbiE